EHREQADRAGADDHHVGPDRFDMGSAFVHAGLTWGFSDPIAMRNKPGRGAVNRDRGGFGPSPTRFAPRRKGRSPRPDAARTEAPSASVSSSPAKVAQEQGGRRVAPAGQPTPPPGPEPRSDPRSRRGRRSR